MPPRGQSVHTKTWMSLERSKKKRDREGERKRERGEEEEGLRGSGTRVDGSSQDQQLLFVSMCVCVPALLKCSFKTQEC